MVKKALDAAYAKGWVSDEDVVRIVSEELRRNAGSKGQGMSDKELIKEIRGAIKLADSEYMRIVLRRAASRLEALAQENEEYRQSLNVLGDRYDAMAGEIHRRRNNQGSVQC